MSVASAAIGGALALDLLVGEPPDPLHPVAWFGRVVDLADRSWRYPRLVGLALALGLPVSAALGLGVLAWTVASIGPVAGVGVGAVVLYLTTSFRALLSTVHRVSRLTETDVPRARHALRALAGRPPDDLDPGQLRSAALESLGENLADGLIAPLTAFALGAAAGSGLGLSAAASLGLACAGAVWIKAVNTMDSMWGYPDRPLGTGAARLDDLAMWLPARLTAGLLAVAFGSPGVLRHARAGLDAVASPNAGWPMGVLAAGLAVRLEKPGHYALNPEAPLPGPTAVARGLRRAGLAGLLGYAVAGVIAWS